MRETSEEQIAEPTCKTAADEEAECPQCEGTMRLWAGFYRCPNCGYKESCCF
jgi:Zn finger protein HypA/HybF involved in hydrogenase expression